MYCPKCSSPNRSDVNECASCGNKLGDLPSRVFLGEQFVFAEADSKNRVALGVDGKVEVFDRPTILSLHLHSVEFGDEQPDKYEKGTRLPLPDRPRLAPPSLQLVTVITDRKIYKPGNDALAFIIAPDAAGRETSIEIQLAGQKVYEASVPLNANGLALHRYPEVREGEYTVRVKVGEAETEATFSVAEFSLSPLIATLDKHEYADHHLRFTLKLNLLARPYSGPAEFGLQCQVCGERVVATQSVKVKDGAAKGDFDLAGHGGPFHVQVTTPEGHTALVSFPGTGAMEREHIKINPLGQTVKAGLLPWQDARPVRGFYIGEGEMNMTPLMLANVEAETGRLEAASDLRFAQVVTFNPRSGETRVIDAKGIGRKGTIEFPVHAPFVLFTVGAFTRNKPFEGWGIVIRPGALDATLTAPDKAAPGEEIAVALEVKKSDDKGTVDCLLLVYDARLEHESPVPKLAQEIVDAMRNASMRLNAGMAVGGDDERWQYRGVQFPGGRGGPVRFAMAMDAMPAGMAPPAAMPMMRAVAMPAAEMQTLSAVAESAVATMVVASTRLEFPELAYIEFFELRDKASRTVKLGDQIGTWRVRAYVLQGVDLVELTHDVEAAKPLYAELDLPAIASEGDKITASVNYHTASPATLLIATPQGQKQVKVKGSGAETFTIQGPGRFEVRIENQEGSDWTVRDVHRPGKQIVTASRIAILDKGQSISGEKVVIYDSPGRVLNETITALVHYPFG